MGELANFDRVGKEFVAHYDEVRGYVRQEVTRINLFDWLPKGPLDVLDFGGGDGRDSLWLAEMGEHVTLIDESPMMIDLARKAFVPKPIDIKQNIRIIQGSIDQLNPTEKFDLILNHCVLMYELDDPEGQVHALASMLKPNGILSLLIKGHEAARTQVTDDDIALDRFDRTGEYVNRRGIVAKSYEPSQIMSMLRDAGLSTESISGVRVYSDDDHRKIQDVRPSDLTRILNKELEASHNPANLSQAQLMHLIAINR